MLAQALEEEPTSRAVEKGEIHRRAAQVDSCDNRHAANDTKTIASS
jgi:hypothetical protein